MDGQLVRRLSGLRELSVPGIFADFLRQRISSVARRRVFDAQRGSSQHVSKLGFARATPDLCRLSLCMVDVSSRLGPGELCAALSGLKVRVDSAEVEQRAVSLPDYPAGPRPSGVLR